MSRAIAFRRRAYLVGWVEVRNPTTTSLSYVGFHPISDVGFHPTYPVVGFHPTYMAYMSGGEKSLTALQPYRPSPFYAFDEVDMFFDGANVELLAKMIKGEAEQAQFIVVSLRRPMMEASQQTWGHTS
ncbi:MAG: chromosome segregation protein SMC [Limnospira sp. PMC 1256.20]|nr:chromosome segregation protein SMC [Limnospira sp. PMC 1256.20]MDT9212317.1 chromosome segregation protein SMC [Limnospira sp. PMC 1256.20]